MQIIVTHKSTDFDGLASLIGASLIYPEALPVLPRVVNPNVRAFLSIHKDILRTVEPGDIDYDAVDRLIVVDTGVWNRLEVPPGLRDRAGVDIVLWDHHVNHSDIQARWKCQEEVGSTTTLLVREIKKRKKTITPIQATLFLAGLYEDTGNLTFPSSKAEDAYAAGHLLENRADLNVVNTFLRQAYGEKQKNILFEMLKTAVRNRIRGCTVSINLQDIQGHIENLAVVVTNYRELVNVDGAFGIFTDRERDRCMVIGRSNTDDIDVGAILKVMGGGGHPAAGSAILKATDPEIVKKRIMELIEGDRSPTVRVKDLMSFPVFTITEDQKMKTAARIMREKGCTGVPVVDQNEKLVGLISRRDFRRIKKESQLNSPVKAFMSTGVVTITPDKSPMQAVRLMVKHDIGRLPVMDGGRIIGIVTRSDSMRYFYNLQAD